MIPHQETMQQGVAVKAASAGTVIAVRDGLRDVDYRTRTLDAIRNQECGNGIRLSHEGGWHSQYCHLRKNSLTVSVGDQVDQGQVLASVGQSGKADGPHLHFQVDYTDPQAQKRVIVDPFVGLTRGQSCGLGTAPLWHQSALDQLDYKAITVVDMGFATTAPTLDGLTKGLFRDKTLSVRAPYLFIWARGLYLNQDDHIKFTILGPDQETLLTYTNTLSEAQPLGLLFSGTERPNVLWDSGTYTGRLEITRFDTQAQGGRFQFESRIELK